MSQATAAACDRAAASAVAEVPIAGARTHQPPPRTLPFGRFLAMIWARGHQLERRHQVSREKHVLLDSRCQPVNVGGRSIESRHPADDAAFVRTLRPHLEAPQSSRSRSACCRLILVKTLFGSNRCPASRSGDRPWRALARRPSRWHAGRLRATGRPPAGRPLARRGSASSTPAASAASGGILGTLCHLLGHRRVRPSKPSAPFFVPPKLSTSAQEAAMSAREQVRQAAALAILAPSRYVRSSFSGRTRGVRAVPRASSRCRAQSPARAGSRAAVPGAAPRPSACPRSGEG